MEEATATPTFQAQSAPFPLSGHALPMHPFPRPCMPPSHHPSHAPASSNASLPNRSSTAPGCSTSGPAQAFVLVLLLYKDTEQGHLTAAPAQATAWIVLPMSLWAKQPMYLVPLSFSGNSSYFFFFCNIVFCISAHVNARTCSPWCTSEQLFSFIFMATM